MLSKKINELNPWFYDVNIGGIRVTPGVGARQSSTELIARTRYRETLLVDEVVKRYDFKNKKMLDIASNCGYWASHYIEHGASSLVAVEGRKEYVDQGNLYWGTNKFTEDFKFICGDVLSEQVWNSLSDLGPFDFSICCGILYHIADHDFLLSKIDSLTKEAVLVDTRISAPQDKRSKIFKESGGWNWDAIGDSAMAKHPTLSYLYNFFESRNYNVIRLSSKISVSADMAPTDNYDTNARVALLCIKQ